MDIKPIEDFQKAQYGCLFENDLVSNSPMAMTPANYFSNFNTYRAYDMYGADLILTKNILDDMFDPVEGFNHIDYNVSEGTAVVYYQAYKRKQFNYFISVDIERYDETNGPEFLVDGYLLTRIYYDNTDRVLCEQVVEDLNYLSSVQPEGEGKIMIVLKTMSGYMFKKRNIKPYATDISKNYNDDFLPVYNTVVDHLKNGSKGVTLFHGLAGTGKTNLIRHLTTVVPERNFVYIPVSMIPHLTDPTFLSNLIDNKNCVLVLEDSETFLKDRDSSGENSVVSAILNLSDGLLSDILGIQIICTFNADLKRVDEALLREGRLVAEYEFGKLSFEKTQKLSRELGFEPKTSMTLAEIYNHDKASHRVQKKQQQIGFGK